MQRLAKEVAEVQGVKHQDQGVVLIAIARMGEEVGHFCRGPQGIRSLCKSLTAIILKGLNGDEEQGSYPFTD